MKQKDLFDTIKEKGQSGEISPSNVVWERLETRLDQNDKKEVPPPSRPRIFSLRNMSIAASIVLVIGAYAVLNTLDHNTDTTTAIQLEDLHTLEVNPKFNIPVAGESATIPSVRTIRYLPTNYQAIEEGAPSKKLVPRQASKSSNKEYGLG